jgi:hypothetical protein
VQNEQLRPWAGRDRVGATLIVAELHEQSLAVKLLDDQCADKHLRPLTARSDFRYSNLPFAVTFLCESFI